MRRTLRPRSWPDTYVQPAASQLQYTQPADGRKRVRFDTEAHSHSLFQVRANIRPPHRVRFDRGQFLDVGFDARCRPFFFFFFVCVFCIMAISVALGPQAEFVLMCVATLFSFSFFYVHPFDPAALSRGPCRARTLRAAGGPRKTHLHRIAARRQPPRKYLFGIQKGARQIRPSIRPPKKLGGSRGDAGSPTAPNRAPTVHPFEISTVVFMFDVK